MYIFEIIVLILIIGNIVYLNNIFNRVKKIDQTVQEQSTILDSINTEAFAALEHKPRASTPLTHESNESQNSKSVQNNQHNKNIQSQLLAQKPIQAITTISHNTAPQAIPSTITQNSLSLSPSNSTTATNTPNGLTINTKPLDQLKTNDSPDIFERSIKWIMDGLLIKIGGLLILLSGIWFLSIGFNNLDANGRIIIGLIFGFVVMSLGIWLTKTKLILGQVLELLGSTVVLIAIISGRFGYGLAWLTPATAFLGCLLIVGINTLVSIKQNSKTIAVLSLVLGYAAPLFGGQSFLSFPALMAYVVLFNLSMLALSYYKKWNFLLLPNILFSSFYLTLAGFSEINRSVVWVYMIILSIIFYFATIFNNIKKPKLSGIDIFNSIFASLICFGWVNLFVPDGDIRTVVVAAYSVIIFGVATALYYFKTHFQFVYLQLCIAFSAMILATTLLFGDQIDLTLVAVALELTGAQFLMMNLFQSKSNPQRLVALLQMFPLFGSFLFLIFGITTWGNVFTSFVLACLALLNSFLFFNRHDEKGDSDFEVYAQIFGLTGFLMAIRWIWIASEKAFGVTMKTLQYGSFSNESPPEQIKQATLAHGVSLTVMTICGILLISRFVKWKPNLQKILGYSLITFVLLRLILIETSSMDTTFKIITFVAIGSLLTLTAFIRKEK